MSILTSNEMYINMKSHPSVDSSEYEAFALEEWRKVRDGITIHGVYISGWLYWHLNHWKIQVDMPDGSRPTVNPYLRDNEWMIAEGLQRAETEKKIIFIGGARQIAKTAFSASYSARKGTIIENSQNLIIGSSKPDLTNITNDIDFGLQNVTPMFRIPRITRDWKSGEVFLGVKTKDGDNKIHSMFRVRNTEGGRNTEVTAGARASSALIDEAAKEDFAKVLQALLPAMKGAYGLRAPIIITATGGNVEKSRDAEILFFNPDTNDCVEYYDEVSGKKTGLFMPGWLRQDFKKDSNLAEYLGIDSPELAQLSMKVSDKELAIKTIKDEWAVAAKDPDPSKLLKMMMYAPLQVEQMFLTEGTNIFPQELLMDQKQFLSQHKPHVDYIELYLDAENKVKHKFTDKRPILHFPHKAEDNQEGVVQIWEFPISNAPNTIYIAATDPYKSADAVYSDSVGSTYIFKRTYDVLSDKFQNMIVAAYHGRPPRKIEKWYETTKLLLKFYNAKTLCENNDYNFVEYLIGKNEAPFYLVPRPQFLYDIHPNSSVTRMYGLHMTPQIKSYLHSCIIEYMTSVLRVDKDENGEEKEILGVRKIIDPLLVEELLKYHPDGNFDRIISFGLVLAYAKSLDRNPISSQKDTRFQELARPYRKGVKSPFTGGVNPFKR